MVNSLVGSAVQTIDAYQRNAISSLANAVQLPARDLETVTYTLLGEARGEGIEGMVAVANVIRNRTNSGIYSSNPVEVVLQPWQFSTNNRGSGGNQRQTRRDVPVGSALYNQAQEIARRYVYGDGIDLTGGSLFYHASNVNWRYADSVRGPYGTYQIGNHTFYPQHPVPQVDVGETELLAGYHEPAPRPLPRSARPVVDAAPANPGTIRQIQRDVALQRTLAAAREVADFTPSLDKPDASNVPKAAEGVTWNGKLQAFVLDEEKDRMVADAVANGARPVTSVGFDALDLGMGAKLGAAFPMTPLQAAVNREAASRREAMTKAIRDVAGVIMPKAAPAELQVALDREAAARREAMTKAVRDVSSLRVAEAPDVIDEGALTTRIVRTVAVDPRTGSPIIVEKPTGTQEPVKLSSLPVGHGRPSPPQVVDYPADRLSPLHNVNDPSEQVSSRGAVGAAMRNRQPPVPLPASSRPLSLAARVVPLSFPPLSSSSSSTPRSAPVGHGRPVAIGKPPNISAPANSNISRPTQTIDPKLRNAISAVSSAPVTQRGVTTRIIRPDGTVTTLPRAGDAQMPADVTPNVPRIIAPNPTSAPVGHGAPRAAPKTAASTVKPQAPITKTITKTVMVPNPEWGKVNPVAVNKLMDIHDREDARIMAAQTPAKPVPKMIPKTVTETITVPAPAPVIEEAPAAAPPPRRVTPRVVARPAPPPKPTIVGVNTGRRYEVGGVYVGGGGRYAYEAQANGTFKKIATVDRTEQGKQIALLNAASTAPTYDVSGGDNAFNPTSVRESERWQTGY